MKKTTIILLVLFCFSVALNFYFYFCCCKDPKQVNNESPHFLGSEKCFGGQEIDMVLARDFVLDYKKSNAGSPCGFILSIEAAKTIINAAGNNNCLTFDLAKNVDPRNNIYETNLIVRSWKYEPIDAATGKKLENFDFKTCTLATISSNVYMAYTLCPKICSNW